MATKVLVVVGEGGFQHPSGTPPAGLPSGAFVQELFAPRRPGVHPARGTELSRLHESLLSVSFVPGGRPALLDSVMP